MDRRHFLQNGVAAISVASSGITDSALAQASSPAKLASSNLDAVQSDREYWIDVMSKISEPVLRAMSERRLKAEMPVEAPHGNLEDRRQYTHLEAMGRLLSGIAPWLELGPENGPEAELRRKYAEWSRLAIQSATDPASPDFLNFNKGGQPVVDTAFFALAMLRAPKELWEKLDSRTQQNVIAALESSRVIRPNYSNWLLFPAIIEAALARMGRPWDAMRIDYAVRSMESWYKGDGVYGDGPEYHSDYYNSFVIHPMLLNVLDTVANDSGAWKSFQQPALARAQRYAAIQERLISPEASFPPTGRSLCYRFGAFHLLAEMSLRRKLPAGVSPQQVRSALTAVMRRMMAAPDVFDQKGWLTVGFYGHQPSIAESYISTGSCYLCSAAWLPLGLPASDPFWSAPPEPWTAKKAWSGAAVGADHALAAEA